MDDRFKFMKRLSVMIASVLLFSGAMAPIGSALAFSDVAPKYKDAVEFVGSKGVSGFSETSFGTDLNIKRVDAAIMLVKVLGLDIEAAPASGFTDVPDRAVKYINALKYAGVTNGKSTGIFDSSSPITRGELAIWIQRGFKLKGTAELNQFIDVADNYKEAVSILMANKITNGKNATEYGTYDLAKRGDFAIFLNRASLTSDAIDNEPEDLEVIDIQ